MSAPSEPVKLKKLDEGVWSDRGGNLYEERSGEIVATGGRMLTGDGELTPEGERALAAPTAPPPEALVLTPRFDAAAMETALENFRQLSELIKKNMKRGHHYGRFPGWQNEQLLEPGASLIMNGFKVYADPVRVQRAEDEEGHFRYNTTVYLRPIGLRQDIVVAAGVGSASSREVKYAYRWVPEDEIPKDVAKEDSRTRTSGSKTLYRIPNADPGDLENTLIKMAMKRAEVDAVLHLPGCSELFPRGQSQEAR